MVPGWVMIICWAYLALLVISRTDKLWSVQPNYLFCGWMCLHSYVTSLTSLVFFSAREENLTNFRKFSQEMKHTRVKWTHYGGHVAKVEGEHNS